MTIEEISKADSESRVKTEEVANLKKGLPLLDVIGSRWRTF